MQISTAWTKYVNRMSTLDKVSTQKVGAYIGSIPNFNFTDPKHMQQLINYAYGISTKYGEAAASLACEMYDSIGKASDVFLDPALPAQLPSYGEVAKTVRGTAKTLNEDTVSRSIGRLVKRVGADTMLHNSIRDGAYFAWIPSGGETCAFCITLASRGWQRASKKALKNGHAEHIHSNCRCQYAIRFNSNTHYRGYDPKKYEEQYYSHEGNPKDKINALRREHYDLNAEKIKEQKRQAYAKRKEIEESAE